MCSYNFLLLFTPHLGRIPRRFTFAVLVQALLKRHGGGARVCGCEPERPDLKSSQ